MRIETIQASTYFGLEYYYLAETKHKKIVYIVMEVLWAD